jgi:hypothetical protein
MGNKIGSRTRTRTVLLGGDFQGYRVLQCYTAWPACAKWRSKLLHRVLQSATHGATNLKQSSKSQIQTPKPKKTSIPKSKSVAAASATTTGRWYTGDLQVMGGDSPV